MSQPRISAPVLLLYDDLQRLVEAIDRRVPQLHRCSEAGIAREASELRQRAVTLMHAIEPQEEPNAERAAHAEASRLD